MNRKTVTILGATGSVGSSALKLIAENPGAYRVAGVAACKDAVKLARIARQVNAGVAVVADEAAYGELKSALSGTGIAAMAGDAAVLDLAALSADVTVAAISGAAGVRPTLKALEKPVVLALANKEALVCAGPLLMDAARKSGAVLIPVDSEHNAIHQIFQAGTDGLQKITLTASGGPFWGYSREKLAAATPAQACRHPVWPMGRKISVDSATMMNKGLEIIEAHYLFNLPPRRIDVLVHPQSVVHGMAHYVDGSVLAHLGMPDMRIPLSTAFGWPSRLHWRSPPLDLTAFGQMTFRVPDDALFPCPGLARRSLSLGAGYCIALNAANEIAVSAFLGGGIGFTHIPEIIQSVLEKDWGHAVQSVETVIETDAAARAFTQARCLQLAA